MAQMLLAKPINEAIRNGYVVKGYAGLEERLHDIRKQIQPVMRELVTKYESDPALRKTILAGIPEEGSYHRGSLISITSESRGKHRDIPLSAAGELFYWATAWLDDIADKNTFRQSSQSVRSQTDDNIAMYASNALYGIVMRSIAEQFESEPDKLAQIFKYFAHNFHVINRGQARDLVMARKPLEKVSISDYMALVEETTGVDVATNLAVGGVSGKLGQEAQDGLYQFGLRLGTLAQIRDDVLDYCEVKDNEGHYVIGKLPFRDVETGKKRLPLLLTKDPDLRTIPEEVYDKIQTGTD
jgi:geranylgeranyl pyrophosphate synthase